MLQKTLSILLASLLTLSMAGCGTQKEPALTVPVPVSETTVPETTVPETTAATESVEEEVLPDGLYLAAFDTDKSMFSVNETKDGKGLLTVKDGEMTIHVTLRGTGILNLYPGTAEEAKKEGAVILQPTKDPVTYPDGYSEEAFGFDIPVPYLNREFDCALIGKKGTWYDHKVSVSDPEPMEASETMELPVTLTGGSGRASVASPAEVTREADGSYTAVIVWSSPNYEFMMVDGVQYDPIQEEGNSTFRIPVRLDEDMAVSAQTIAMSTPHLVEYTLHFESAAAK